MAKLKVTILNFHSLFSHLEILLEDTSTTPSTYYVINQWDPAQSAFTNRISGAIGSKYQEEASSTFSFEIEEDPKEIIKAWRDYQRKTLPDACISSYNCADAGQWFLNKYAHVPNPRPFAPPYTVNHVIMGIFLPSYMPIGITLPGRIMDNAKFHINARKIPDHAPRFSDLSLKIGIAVAAFAIAACIAGIIAASIFLTGGLSALVITSCVVAGALSTNGLFKPANVLAARNIAKDVKNPGNYPDKCSTRTASEPLQCSV